MPVTTKRTGRARSRASTPAAKVSASPPPAASARISRWRAALIVAAGALAYANSLAAPFTLDDDLAIVGNESIRRLSDVTRLLWPERELPVAGRPLVNISFALNYAIGGLDVRGYHLVNVALHLLCALLLYAVVRQVLELPASNERVRRHAGDLSFATALLWTLHPLNSEVVDYVTQRTESMMALCYLLTICASLRAVRSARAGVWSATAVVACACGMACKESMATAPLIVALVDRTLVFGSFKAAVRARWRLYVGLAAAWLVLAALMWSGPRVHSAGLSTRVSPWTYLLNQTVMIVCYLRLSVWPHSLVLNYGWPRPLTLLDVWPYAVLLVVLAGVIVVALARRWPSGMFGAWFFVTLAPTSSVVPIATEVGAERRMYLPLMAIIVLAVIVATLAWDRVKGWAGGRSPTARRAVPAGAIALAVVSVALAAGTMMRNREYRSHLVMADTVLQRWPSGLAHSMRASALIATGRHEEGIAELRVATREYPRGHYNLGVELFNQGQVDEAVVELQAFVREEPDLLEVVTARELLGRAFEQKQQWKEALEQYRLLVMMRPANVDARGWLAHALVMTGEFDEAGAQYRRYLGARPSDVAALTNLGVCLLATDRLDEGIDVFRRALAIDARHADAHRNLALALVDRRQVEEATSHAEQAVTLTPNDAAAHDVLGRVLAIRGRLDEAIREFERAVALDPGYSQGQEDLRRVLTLKGSGVRGQGSGIGDPRSQRRERE